MIPAIILARGGSKGILDKNIMEFCGKPLIVWSIEQALNDGFECIVVSTDSDKIKNIVKDYNKNIVIIDRPAELATDEIESDYALIHACKRLEFLGYEFEYVINLQCTSPLRKKDDINKAWWVFKNGNYDSLFSCSVCTDYCIWDNKKSITYNYKKRGRRQDKKPLYLENGSIYIFKKDLLYIKKRRLGGKIGRYIMRPWQSFEIDEYSDVPIIEYFLNKEILNA